MKFDSKKSRDHWMSRAREARAHKAGLLGDFPVAQYRPVATYVANARRANRSVVIDKMWRAGRIEPKLYRYTA